LHVYEITVPPGTAEETPFYRPIEEIERILREDTGDDTLTLDANTGKASNVFTMLACPKTAARIREIFAKISIEDLGPLPPPTSPDNFGHPAP